MTEKMPTTPEGPEKPEPPTFEEIRWRLSPDNPEMKAHRDRLQLVIDRLGEIAERARAAR